MAFSLCGSAYAATNASSYLSTYSVALTAGSNHQMVIDATAYGTSIMDKIGVSVANIDQKINGVWSDYENLYALNNPSFYQYDTVFYAGNIYFTGTQGVQYRVTLTVYSGKDGGYDTGTITSYTVTCN